MPRGIHVSRSACRRAIDRNAICAAVGVAKGILRQSDTSESLEQKGASGTKSDASPEGLADVMSPRHT
ncbi:MAG: hypothetical protein JWM93_3502 [Frankiales bacterium]|nr:hypothetical protein [Frankiales bacterium]